jgi:hypothetical protein
VSSGLGGPIANPPGLHGARSEKQDDGDGRSVQLLGQMLLELAA